MNKSVPATLTPCRHTATVQFKKVFVEHFQDGGVLSVIVSTPSKEVTTTYKRVVDAWEAFKAGHGVAGAISAYDLTYRDEYFEVTDLTTLRSSDYYRTLTGKPTKYFHFDK